MIDPKMLELSVYDGIPHLLSPVVTDPKKAVVALKWVVGEMEERYRKMSKMGVRNIDGYNGRVREALAKGEMFKRTVQTGFDEETGDPVFETEEFQPETMPYIVVIVDEMADLMMVAGKEIEACIQRLAQMARASRHPPDHGDAAPLGRCHHRHDQGELPDPDQLPGDVQDRQPHHPGRTGRRAAAGHGRHALHGGRRRDHPRPRPLRSATRKSRRSSTTSRASARRNTCRAWSKARTRTKRADIDAVLGLGGSDDGEDALYDMAVAIVVKDRKCSTSYIQRKLAIGYNKAARLVEQMEEQGVVSSANHVGKREMLVPEV